MDRVFLKKGKKSDKQFAFYGSNGRDKLRVWVGNRNRVLSFLIFLTTRCVVESVIAASPSCGCFGVLAGWERGHPSPWAVVARNGILVALLLIGIKMDETQSYKQKVPGQPLQIDGKKGFTLIETLVVIAIIGILVALFMPVLRQVRDRAREAVSFSNLRSHATIISAYAGDFSGTMPWFSNTTNWNLTLEYGNIDYGYPHFYLAYLWPVGLVEYYGGVWPHESLRHPGVFDENAYYLTSTSFAGSQFWVPLTREGPSQWKAQGIHSVQYTSAKAMLVTRTEHGLPQWYGDQPSVTFALFDGSAQQFATERLIKPVLTGEGGWYGMYLPRGVFGMHTRGGLFGRDIR